MQRQSRYSCLFILSLIAVAWTLPATAYEPPVRARGSALVNVRNYGAAPGDSRDDTAAIQRAINALPSAGGTVYIPAGRYMIDAKVNLHLRSRMHLQLAPKAILKTIPNNVERSVVLRLNDLVDVEVSGGQILGERSQHIGTAGEWGHGILVRGSDRVTIRNIRIANHWGDGISVGQIAKTTIPSRDVVIDNIISTNNRRQGLSIGRVVGMKVYDSQFTYTNGTAPEYGIDIEPDPANGRAENIHIENCNISHNAGGGILAYKEVRDVRIIKNTISYNVYGIFTVETVGAEIRGNRISHNNFKGIQLSPGSVDFRIAYNQLRNNSTKALGVTNDTNPLVAITGVLSGRNGTAAHLNISSDTSNIRVQTNYYAK